MKKIFRILVVIIILGMVASCMGGNKKKEEKKTETHYVVVQSDPNEKYFGTWIVTAIETEGSRYSVEELKVMGIDEFAGYYIILKEGGSTILYDSITGKSTTGNWLASGDDLTLNAKEGRYEDGMLVFDADGDKIFMEKYSSTQDLAKLADSLKADDQKVEEKTVEEKPVETNKESDGKKTGLSEDFLAAMNAYEEFYDEYIAFMKKYQDSGYSSSMLMDYLLFMNKLAKFDEEFEKWDSADMSDEEVLYYSQVNMRVSQKLLESLK